jgi:hypothetical protein
VRIGRIDIRTHEVLSFLATEGSSTNLMVGYCAVELLGLKNALDRPQPTPARPRQHPAKSSALLAPADCPLMLK